MRKLRFLALLGVLSVVALVSFTFGLVKAIESELPSLDPGRSDERVQENGFIYASDGKTILAVLRGDEARVVVDSEDIAPVMKQAIVAVEDKRFWDHKGIDIRGIARAVWADIRNRELVEGGSTITQQFVKNTYTENELTVSRKLKEAALAWQLERAWSKDKILTAYLNTIYFGNNAYGIQMAARAYFGKRARDLNLAEAALLAGIPANPTAYDPVARPKAAKNRREVVLDLMLDQGLITEQDHAQANAAPVPKAEDVRLPGTRGPAQYFVEYVKSQLVPYYGSGEVYGGGLEIYTTIDMDLQKLAIAAIEKWLPDDDGPTASLVAIDPRDGSIKAMVGGPGFAKSEFNLAVQGERQAGSAFKPFVLAAALAQGISPQTHFVSRPTTINLGDKIWSVRNYEGAYLGSIDVETATVHSDNAVYAQLTEQVGPKNVAKMANALGVMRPLDDFFAIGLGVEAVSPLDMARAYASFANGGRRVDGAILGNVPRAVTRIVDGDRVDDNTPQHKQILDPNANAWLTNILRRAVDEGTGKRAALDDRAVAGKTGTTENYGDAWFVGYTPQLAVAVWVGYPDRLEPMLTQFQGEEVAGGTYPALIWRTFARNVLKEMEESPESFPGYTYPPAGAYRVAYRDDSWTRLDNGNCRRTRTVVYFAGFEPQRQADCKRNEVDVPDVVGSTVDEAEARLLSMPLTPEVITRPAKPGERLGFVVKQIPKDGVLSSWETVRLVVPKATHATVPEVVGLELTTAERRLEDLDLNPSVEAFTDGHDGIVLAQSPRPGRAAVPNMAVDLVVGRG